MAQDTRRAAAIAAIRVFPGPGDAIYGIAGLRKKASTPIPSASPRRKLGDTGFRPTNEFGGAARRHHRQFTQGAPAPTHVRRHAIHRVVSFSRSPFAKYFLANSFLTSDAESATHLRARKRTTGAGSPAGSTRMMPSSGKYFASWH